MVCPKAVLSPISETEEGKTLNTFHTMYWTLWSNWSIFVISFSALLFPSFIRDESNFIPVKSPAWFSYTSGNTTPRLGTRSNLIFFADFKETNLLNKLNWPHHILPPLPLWPPPPVSWTKTPVQNETILLPSNCHRASTFSSLSLP